MNCWKTKKRQVRLIFKLFIPLFFTPVPYVHFYFPGSPLCFFSRCAFCSLPLLPQWPRPLFIGPAHSHSPSCLKTGQKKLNKSHSEWNGDFLGSHSSFPLWVRLHASLLVSSSILLNSSIFCSILLLLLLFSPLDSSSAAESHVYSYSPFTTRTPATASPVAALK